MYVSLYLNVGVYCRCRYLPTAKLVMVYDGNSTILFVCPLPTIPLIYVSLLWFITKKKKKWNKNFPLVCWTYNTYDECCIYDFCKLMRPIPIDAKDMGIKLYIWHASTANIEKPLNWYSVKVFCINTMNLHHILRGYMCIFIDPLQCLDSIFVWQYWLTLLFKPECGFSS